MNGIDDVFAFFFMVAGGVLLACAHPFWKAGRVNGTIALAVALIGLFLMAKVSVRIFFPDSFLVELVVAIIQLGLIGLFLFGLRRDQKV